jgi:signal transduction histidine kinase
VDVTRQTKLEAQLQKARKMETVGTLAGGIAHEFNNLLMTIQGNTSLIQYDLDMADPHFQMLVKIEEAVSRGVKLTQQLLGYAKKGKYEVKSLNVNRLVQKTAQTFGKSQKDISIHYELSEDILRLILKKTAVVLSTYFCRLPGKQYRSRRHQLQPVGTKAASF